MTDTQAKRSGCLAAFIIILIVIHALSALGSFLAGPLIAGLVPEYATNTSSTLLSGVLSLLNIVFLIGVWKYKRWGFYGFIAVSVINIALSVYMGSNLLMAVVLGLILPAILYFLIKPIWKHMT